MNFTNKKTQILLTNLAWLIVAYIFYKKSFLNLEQIIDFVIILLISTNFLLLKNKIFKIISIIWITLIWFFFILGFLPLYQENPDWSNFNLTQSIEFLFIWNPKNVEIQEKSLFWEQKIIPSSENQKLFFIESESRDITFNEIIEESKITNKLVIKIPDNTIYILYPWSKIQITKKLHNYEIIKLYWKNEYYQPKNNQTIIINPNIKEQKNESEFSLWYMIDDYENKKTKHIIKQWWWILIMQPIYQNFSKQILDIAYFIRPKQYENNIKNYELYKEKLWRKNTNKNYEEDQSWRKNFIKQIQKWREETRNFKQT